MEKYGIYFCSALVGEVACPLDIRRISKQYDKSDGRLAYVTIIEGNSEKQVLRHLFRSFTDYVYLSPTMKMEERHGETWDGSIEYLVEKGFR